MVLFKKGILFQEKLNKIGLDTGSINHKADMKFSVLKPSGIIKVIDVSEPHLIELALRVSLASKTGIIIETDLLCAASLIDLYQSY